MKKTMKTLTVALLVLAMLSGALAMTAAAAEVASGTSGNVSWTLTDDGTLTVSGEGAMADHSNGSQPWYAYKDSIKTVIITKGVTSISAYAFYEFPALATVKIAGSVTAIGNNAFYSCTNLSTVEYYGTSNPAASDNAFFGSYVVVKVLSSYSGNVFCGKMVRATLDAANEPLPPCDHAEHTQTGCTACGATDGSIHSFVSGTCSVCGLTCTHDGTYDSATGKCSTCGELIAEASVSLNSGAEVFYMSLENALVATTRTKNESDKAFVKVYNDVVRDLYVILNRTVTLDLNGHTVRSTTDLPQVGSDTTSGELTIIDSGTGGQLIATGFGNGIVVAGGSKLTVLSGSIIVSNSSPIEARDDTQIIIGGTAEIISKTLHGVALRGDNITMSVTGGSITGGQYSISIGTYTQLKSLTISGGTIKGAIYEWTYPGSSIKPVITGGSFPEGIEIGGGNAYLSLLLGDGYVYYVDGVPTAVDAGIMKLEGNVTVKLCDHSGEFDTATGNCAVCGEYAAVASLTTADATPVVTYYATFEEVFTAAQEINGCTVTILCDGELLNGVKINKGSFIVDLNDKTITDLFQLHGGSVTVKGNGTVKEQLGVYDSNSTLIIEGGAYEMVTATYGNLTVRGGTFDYIHLSKNYHDSLAEILPKDYYLYDENGEIINAGAVVGNDTYYRVDNVTVKQGADLSTDAVITVNSTVYNGAAQTPNGSHVTVTVGGVVLEHNVDYTISVYPDDDFINVGTYTITIYGEGNYTGSVEKTFTIEKATLTEADFTVENLTPTFNFGPQEVAVTLPAGLDEQYVTIGYLHSGAPLPGAPTDAGTYKVLVMVSGSPNHEDATVEYELVIAPAAATVELLDPDAEFFYTGQKHEPELVATVNGGIPFEPTEFGGTVTYTGNIMVGTATATLGGNFTGSVNFEIQKAIPTVTVSAPLDKGMPGYVMNLTAVSNALEETSFTILPGEGYTVDGMQITINEGVAIGSTITVKVASTATANYQAAEGELVLTIGVPTVDTSALEAKLAQLEQKLAELETTHGADVADLRGEIETLRQLIAALDDTYATDQELADAILAVTNTLNELTETVNGLADIYATKAELEAAVAALEALIGSNDADIETINDLIDTINTTLAALADKDVELAGAIADLEKLIADLTEAVTGNSLNIATHTAQIAELQAALAGLDSVLTQLGYSSLSDALAGLDAALDALADRVAKNETDIAALQAALEKAIEELNKAIAEGDEANARALAEAVANLEQALADAVAALEQADEANRLALEKLIAAAQSALEEAIAALEGRVSQNEDDIAALQAELARLYAELRMMIESNDTDIEAINRMLESINATIETLATKADVATEIAILTDLINDLADRVANNEANINANIDAISALQTTVRNLAQTVAAQDAALAQSIATLSANLAALESRVAQNEADIAALRNALKQAVEELNAAIAAGDEANAKALAQAVIDLTAMIEAVEEAAAAEDAAIRAELAAAKAALQGAISVLRQELYQVQKELLATMEEKDAVLDGKIAQLAAALEAAIAASQAADEALRTELTGAIEAAEATLTAAIEQVAADLAAARMLLNTSIANGDKALHNRINALTAALEEAIAASEAADGALRAELNARIDEALAALNAAIAQVRSELADTKAQLTARDDQLHKLVIVAIVIASVGVAGCVALTVYLIVDKRKKQ